jgi:PAS domain-containing protein
MTSARHIRQAGRAESQGGQPLRVSLSHAASTMALACAAGMASLAGATPAAAQIATLPTGELARSLFPDVLGAFSMSMVVGLAVFAATTAILHVRERGRWIRREAQLAADLDSAMARAEQAEIFGSTEDQVTVIWAAPAAKAEIHGQPEFLLVNGTRMSPLAFGSWASPDQVKLLGDAVDQLKARGEPFDHGVHSRAGHYVEARGRAVSGRAVLHLRDVSQTRRSLLESEQDRAASRAMTARLSALMDASPCPAWLRDGTGELVWVNAAYARRRRCGEPCRGIGCAP